MKDPKRKFEQFKQHLYVCIFPVRPSITCWLTKLALSHQNFENPWCKCKVKYRIVLD